MPLFSLCTSNTAAVVTKENSLSIVCLSKLHVIYLILCYELRWWFNFIKFRDYDKLSGLRNVRKEIGIKVENIKINIVAKKRINKRIKIEFHRPKEHYTNLNFFGNSFRVNWSLPLYRYSTFALKMFALEISSISKPRFSFPRMTDLIKPCDELRHKALTGLDRGWRHGGEDKDIAGEIVKPSLFILSWKREKKGEGKKNGIRTESTRLDGLFQNINALNLLWTLVASLWTLLCSLQWSGERVYTRTGWKEWWDGWSIAIV